MTFLVMGHHWCWHQSHMLMAAMTTITPLHSLHQNNQNEVQYYLFHCVTPLVWHHVMVMALSMVLLHSIGQDDQNQVQCELFGHVMPLASVPESHDADIIIKGTITFLS